MISDLFTDYEPGMVQDWQRAVGGIGALTALLGPAIASALAPKVMQRGNLLRLKSGRRPGFFGEATVREAREAAGRADIPSWEAAASTEAPGGRAALGAAPQGSRSSGIMQTLENIDAEAQLRKILESLGGSYTGL